MRQPIPPTWIVVMDATRASFYRLHHDPDGHRRIDPTGEALVSGLHRHSHDIVSDRPGRAEGAGGLTPRSAFEAPHDPHRLEKHDFAAAVVSRLKAALDAHAFERLAVVAPPRSLGELRDLAPETLKRAIWREIGKDLVQRSPKELWEQIGAELIDRPGESAAG